MELILYEYCNVLAGRQKNISNHFFSKDAQGIRKVGGTNQKLALFVIRYALEEVMKWTPEESVERFDEYILRQLKLDNLLTCIDWAPDNPDASTKYILSLLYPDLVKLNRYQMLEEIYKKILNNERHIPKDFFLGTDGFLRYCFCLKYALECEHPFSSIAELYDFFNSPQCNDFLSRVKLYTPGYQFGINKFECLRYITRSLPNQALYYNWNLFNIRYLKHQKEQQS